MSNAPFLRAGHDEDHPHFAADGPWEEAKGQTSMDKFNRLSEGSALMILGTVPEEGEEKAPRGQRKGMTLSRLGIVRR